MRVLDRGSGGSGGWFVNSGMGLGGVGGGGVLRNSGFLGVFRGFYWGFVRTGLEAAGPVRMRAEARELDFECAVLILFNVFRCILVMECYEIEG